jgi:ferredoxin-NADP reductase
MPATLLSSTRVASTYQARITRVVDVATGIRSFELASQDGLPLPDWMPGAHIDLHLPSGTIRQYSLCGEPGTDRYRIAVLELPAGRGGSVEAHRDLREGVLVEVGAPRNEFRLAEAPAYVFVAGGIGITPILAMIREVARAGKPWRLVYGARTAAHFAFTDELDRLATETWGIVEYIAQDVHGHPDLPALVRDSAGQGVYCCGPAPLMDALHAEMVSQGRAGQLVIERFTPAAQAPADDGGSFEVELVESGLTVTVGPDQSILEAVRGAGVDAPSSCEMGICGTCETRVVSGDVDHRDSLLTQDERDAGDVMMICVSRAACAKLVLAR